MTAFPGLFVSHGAPTLATGDHPARAFLSALGARLGRPEAIVVVTAHWTTRQPSLSAGAHPATIHDFRGFPPDLYTLLYPAPGAPGLARLAAGRLRTAGLEADIDESRGLDHGTWVPLLLMYPAADIPVVQVSVQPGLGPAHHLRLGRALAPLRRENILVMGSGAATHNLAEYGDAASPEPSWARDFAEWLAENVEAGSTDALLDYRARAPAAARNHPTDEHLLPLFAALGAATPGTPGRRIHASTDHGVLRLDAYRWD
ncbi:MAG: class III extradiol ring-cleavage dioxygenase [Magnetospirillum sp.]|nr:class III extradiol ring-cleavage dioxygenase [Magnetospirillum sp.]